MAAKHEFFNTHVGRGRVAIEHTIGMIKAKYQNLKGLRVNLSSPTALKKCIKLVESCVVLHNLCIGNAAEDVQEDGQVEREEEEEDERNETGSVESDGDSFSQNL